MSPSLLSTQNTKKFETTSELLVWSRVPVKRLLLAAVSAVCETLLRRFCIVMAEEKRSQHLLVYGSSSPTPAASSAGASSPAIPGNMTSVDWCGFGKGQRGCSLSKSAPFLPRQSARSANTAVPVSSNCRPWDRADLLKHLSTFTTLTWLAAPKMVGALACARRGWVNVEDDLIACACCGMRIKFPQPSLEHHSEDEYAEHLDNGHKISCPWKGNACAESMAHFLPLPPSALVGGFDDRCDALLQFRSLPVISGSAIDHMKLTRGSEIDRLLLKPPPSLARKFEDGRFGSLDTGNSRYYEAQRLISLCGWEPRFLPHVLDCCDNSAQSTRKGKSLPFDEGPSHMVDNGGPGPMVSDVNCNPPSAVLDCSLCGATVNLKRYVTVTRSLALGPSGLSKKYTGTLMRNMSSASAVDGWRRPTRPLLKEREQREEAVFAEEKSSSYNIALDLNATVANGPTQILQPPEPNLHSAGQPEGSDMGGPIASYESFGPGFSGHRMDEGGSTVDRPQSRAYRSDSIEGTVLDFEGDEADDGELRYKRFYAGESSKHKRAESSSGDCISYGLGIIEPGCSNYSQPDADFDADDSQWLKRSRREEILQEIVRHQLLPAQPAENSVYSSSIIAVDTSNSKEENSMESVENCPHGNDIQATAGSWERSERVGNENLNDLEQAQQSTCHQGHAGLVNDGPLDQDISTSDEGGVDMATQNDVRCATASIRMGHVVSVGTSGGSVQMVASHEAEIHGADLSVHKTDSFVNDTGLVTELMDFKRQTSESVPEQTQCFQDVRKIANMHHNSIGSHDVAPSCSAVMVYSKDKHEESGQEESSEAQGKGKLQQLSDKSVDANDFHDVLVQTGASCGEAEAGKHVGNQRLQHLELDPVHEHHYYCPWINGYVAAAGAGEERVKISALCGWQLTLDALDELHIQKQVLSAPMESESAASMHKGTEGVPVYGLYATKHT